MFNPVSLTNSLPFTNNGPFVVPSNVQPQSGSSPSQSQNGNQASNTPFNSQPLSGQMSASGLTSGQALPGSGVSSGQMSASGFVSGNPVSGGTVSGFNSSGTQSASSFSAAVSGYTGSQIGPFSSQTSNNSMNTAGFSANGQFNPNVMNSMFRNFSGMQGPQGSGSFNPAQLLGRSKSVPTYTDHNSVYIPLLVIVTYTVI